MTRKELETQDNAIVEMIDSCTAMIAQLDTDSAWNAKPIGRWIDRRAALTEALEALVPAHKPNCR